jgi:hypothetical protein
MELNDTHALPPWKAQLTSKIFTPLQAHGMEKFTAWRGRIFSLWMPFTNPIPHKSK